MRTQGETNWDQSGSLVQFGSTKWRFLVLQRSSYHGDGLQWGYLVFPICTAAVVFFLFIFLTPPFRFPFHGGASWMQISDCRLVGATLQATSHWTRTFWCKAYLFLSQLSDHFRHAANPNIVWRNKQKKKKAWNWANVKPLFPQFEVATCSRSEIHSQPFNYSWYEHKTFLNKLSWD